jgi:predicted transcriptional regulator
MNTSDIGVLLKKAEELKALFVLGQRVIPFLEEIFMFVNEIQPLLDEINQSIEENIKKMPNVSKQLSKVTEATEMATTEIMDIVDGVVYKTDIILKNVKEMAGSSDVSKNTPLSILKLIYESIQKNEDFSELEPKLKEAIENIKKQSSKDHKKLVEDTEKLVQSIQSDSSAIMMSLQVQDITSQQIAAVNHLLNTIQTKLETILQKFQETEISDIVQVRDGYDERTNVSKMHRSIAFDPEAVESYSRKEFRQDEVDKMMKDHENGDVDEEDEAEDMSQPTTQDDIDALFSNNKDHESGDVDEAEDMSQPTTQDDIDALFSNNIEDDDDLDEPSEDTDIDDSEDDSDNEQNDSKETDITDETDDMDSVSQDDIDALFGK